MAGGGGRRLWPLSSSACPKQFRDVMGSGRSLLRQTWERVSGIFPDGRVLVVTGAAYAELTREHLPELPAEHVLVEPFGRNTAACVALAAYWIARRDPGAVMVVVPSDHFIADDEAFGDTLRRGVSFVSRHGGLLTVGISPTRPETGYGYIQVGEESSEPGISRVKRFTEKPAAALALEFLSSGDFLWNAGVFVWRVSGIIEEFAKHLKEIHLLFEQEYAGAVDPDAPGVVKRIYDQCPAISIDFGIMERAERVYVIRGNFGWSDVGTWRAFHEVSRKDASGNASRGAALFLDSSGCVVDLPPGTRAVVAGINDCIIAGREDVLMICSREREEEIRHFEEMLGALKSPDATPD